MTYARARYGSAVRLVACAGIIVAKSLLYKTVGNTDSRFCLAARMRP